MLEGTGRIIIQNSGKNPKKVLIYIPQKIAIDSQFPFKEPGEVKITVDPAAKRIVIEAVQGST